MSADVYDSANMTGYISGVTGALMYHNLEMGPSGDLTAKQAIWDRYNAGTNLGVTGWYNYTQDITLKTDWYVERIGALNNTLISGTIYLMDSSGTPLGNIAGFGLSPAAPTGGGINVIDSSSTTTGNAALGNGGYHIGVDASITYTGAPPPPPPGSLVVVADSTGSDVDGVGSATTRSGRTGMTFDDTAPLAPPVIVLGGTAVAYAISVGKRSRVEITFTG